MKLGKIKGHSAVNVDWFMRPFLLTKNRTLVVAGDGSFIAGRLFRGDEADKGWKFAIKNPFDEDEMYLGYTEPGMFAVRKNRRVALVAWDAGKRVGVKYREFR